MYQINQMKDNLPVLEALVKTEPLLEFLAIENKTFYWELGYSDPYKAVAKLMDLSFKTYPPRKRKDWMDVVEDVYNMHNRVYDLYHQDMS